MKKFEYLMEDCDIFGDLSIGISKNLRKDAEMENLKSSGQSPLIELQFIQKKLVRNISIMTFMMRKDLLDHLFIIQIF